MKILYFFPEYETPMFSWQRTHFINELNCHGIEFETFNPLVFETPEQANEEFVSIMVKGAYDMLLSSVCYEGMIYPEVLNKAKHLGIPSLCIRWDNLTIPFFDEQQANKFDLLWLTSQETSYLYDKWKASYIIQPYAANPDTFKPSEKKIIRKVCFIGTPYGSRSLMINQLSRHKIPVSAFFGGQKKQELKISVKYPIISPSPKKILFDRMRFKEGRKIMLGMIVNKLTKKEDVEKNDNIEFHPALSPNEIGHYYSEFALSLASTSTNHTDALRNPLKIINLRNFEIPMSGGIEFCKYNKELANYFKDGEEIVFYRSDEELVDKARYYLEKASDQNILKMKVAARKRAENEHTWWSRFTKAFDALGLKY